jgi:hypothetical protein
MTQICEPIFAVPFYIPPEWLRGIPVWVAVMFVVGSTIFYVAIQMVIRGVTRKQRKQYEDELWEKNSKKDDNDAA